MSAALKIGKANFSSGGYVKKNWWKLKDGESVFRILPPMGDLAESGKWSVFHSVHYGYKNSEGKIRAFLSTYVKNRKTGMVEVPDAALERITKLKAMQEEAKKTGDKVRFDRCKDLLQVYNLDNNHYVNAMDLQGNIGILKLRHRAMLALKAEIDKLRAEGCEDPTSVNDGRYFVFRRTGNALDTSFQVTVYRHQIEVPGIKGKVEQQLVHSLDASVMDRLSKEAAQLDKLFKVLTPEQISEIVKTSDLETGKSPAIDKYFPAFQAPVATTSTSTSIEDEDPSIGEDDYGLPSSTPAQSQAPSAQTSTIQQSLPPVAAASTTTDDDDDFLKSLE